MDYYKTFQQSQLRKAHLEALKEAFERMSHLKLIHCAIELYDLSYAIRLADTEYQAAQHHLALVQSKLDANQLRTETLKTALKKNLTDPLLYDEFISDMESTSLQSGPCISADINEMISDLVNLQSTQMHHLLYSYRSLWSLLPTSIKDNTHDSLSSEDFASAFSCLIKSFKSDRSLENSSNHTNSTISKSTSAAIGKKRSAPSVSAEMIVANPTLYRQKPDAATLIETATKCLISPQRQLVIPVKRRITRSSR
jgi:hypothetical protein